jgi:hypothetical protein
MPFIDIVGVSGRCSGLFQRIRKAVDRLKSFRCVIQYLVAHEACSSKSFLITEDVQPYPSYSGVSLRASALSIVLPNGRLA